MIYKIGSIHFEGFETYGNREYGDITVGGDQGDVYIRYAAPDEEGVQCEGVELHTIWEDLDEDEVIDIINDVIRFSYEAIRGETFIGRTEW